MKRILLPLCAVLMTAGLVWAGEPVKAGASAAQMSAMKAEMAKCAVCKHMAAHLDEIGPVKMETVSLNDGVAIMHSVPAAKADMYHKAAAEVAEAGGACMTMTDAQAKEQLCAFCQGTRDVMKSGGKMSNGMTKTGDMMVITASDAAV